MNEDSYMFVKDLVNPLHVKKIIEEAKVDISSVSLVGKIEKAKDILNKIRNKINSLKSNEDKE